MQASNNCFDLIKSQEGCILHPYTDEAGIPTIGWGTIRYPDGVLVTMQDAPVTQDQADDYLACDVKDTVNAVNAMIPSGLNQNQFDSLVDFAYNVGTGALYGSTLLRLIKANPSDPAITNAFLMWSKIHLDGRLVQSAGLLSRRKKEAALYFS
jgi:lysozyme